MPRRKTLRLIGIVSSVLLLAALVVGMIAASAHGGLFVIAQQNGATGGKGATQPSATTFGGATLGNYAPATVQLSADATVTPDAAPSNTARINISTSTNFKGKLEGDPTTGVVRITDAHPAGTYTVTVTAFPVQGASATKTFTLTVTTPATCGTVAFALTNFGVGIDPLSVAVGDFNGDGKQDLATANINSSNVSVLLRQCPLTCTPPPTGRSRGIRATATPLTFRAATTA